MNQTLARIDKRMRELRVKEIRGALFEAHALELMRRQMITLDVDFILSVNRKVLEEVGKGKDAYELAILTEAVDEVEAVILKGLRYRKEP